MNKPLVVHHRADLDGISSGEIARKFLGNAADYLGWDYGDEIPNLESRDLVYLIDISFPVNVLNKYSDRIVLIDHHKTLIDSISSSYPGYRIEGVAACRLAWQFFFGEAETLPIKEDYVACAVKEPYGIQLLGCYDIWDKRNPDTDIYQVGLQSVKVIEWDRILKGDEEYIDYVLGRGEAVWDYTEVTNAQISTERAFDVNWEGYNFRALNNARSNSLTFKASIKEHHDGCLSYGWNGELWKFSIYGVEHKKTLDFSPIAKKYGGGGHPQACGFTLKTLPDALGWPKGSVAS